MTYNLTRYYIRLQSHLASWYRPNPALDLLWRFDAYHLPKIYNHDFNTPQSLSRSSWWLRWQTNQIAMQRQLADSSSQPRSRSSSIFKNMKICVHPLFTTTTFKLVFLFVGGAVECSCGRVSHHLSVRQLWQCSLLCPRVI